MKPLPPLLKVALVSVCQLVKDEGGPDHLVQRTQRG